MTAILQVKHITKRFGGVAALQNVSFDLAAGQMLAMIGPNGAGKSTCFNVINGQLKPDSGYVALNDDDITGARPEVVFHRGVSRTFQVAATFTSMTAQENIQLALLSKGRRLGISGTSARRHFREQSMQVLERIGIADLAQRPVSDLAYADLKSLELAIAIATDPVVLLMDEPTAGMAAHERQQLMTLTKSLARERNTAVLFTEHSMDAVFGFADQVAVLARGELIAWGKPQQIRDNPLVQAVYLGTVHE
jgi:branched-chain amino acid transport system ATP-binding protein